MKKNKFMRVAAVLLILCLATTCAISSTFAKYTTSNTGSDSARVAKWGFADETITIDLFDATYDSGAVAAANGSDKVVAPGTTGSATILLYPAATVAPEVAYSFTLAVDKAAGTNDDLMGKLVWTLDGTKVGTNGTFAELQSAVAALSNAQVAANSLPKKGSADLTQIEIGWTWAFDGDDATDTDLGQGGSATAGITLTVTATQLDTITP